MIPKKLCSKCNIEKELSCFSMDRKRHRYCCKECAYKKTLAWRLKNKERTAEHRKMYKSRHVHETRLQSQKDSKKYYYKTGQKNRLLKRYGLSQDQFERLLLDQNGLCKICGQKDADRELAIDHCHATGRIRGLLCQKCNTALGLFKDNIELLRKSIIYLS